MCVCAYTYAYTYTNTYTVIHIHINIISEYILLRSIDFSRFFVLFCEFDFSFIHIQFPFFRVLVLIYKCHLHPPFQPSSLHLYPDFWSFSSFRFSFLVRPIVYNSIARCVTLSLPFAGCPTPLGFTPWPRVSWTGPWTDPHRSGRWSRAVAGPPNGSHRWWHYRCRQSGRSPRSWPAEQPPQRQSVG